MEFQDVDEISAIGTMREWKDLKTTDIIDCFDLDVDDFIHQSKFWIDGRTVMHVGGGVSVNRYFFLNAVKHFKHNKVVKVYHGKPDEPIFMTADGGMGYLIAPYVYLEENEIKVV